MTDTIGFPNLGITLEHVGKSFEIFGFPIAFYGIIIGIAILSGAYFAMAVAKKTHQDSEFYFDLTMIAVVTSLLGARLYYVIFSWGDCKEAMCGRSLILEAAVSGNLWRNYCRCADGIPVCKTKEKEIPFSG